MNIRPASKLLPLVGSLVVSLSAGHHAAAQYRYQPVVPGTGRLVEGGGDDFEDADWQFVHNFPKSSRNIDERERRPLGVSRNGLWQESAKRGQPDVLKRVTPPEGGIPGSNGALLMRTLYSSIPRTADRKGQQDDLLFDALSATGGGVPVSQSPSVVVRVYLPPFEQWENRTATSFGFRAAVEALAWREKRALLIKRRVQQRDIYYPGIFIQFNSKTDSYRDEDSAVFIIRGGDNGEDYTGPEIKQTGWWTLGMSFTPDGRTHFYASPGVDALTEKDRIGSHFPQSVKCKRFFTYFFNVCNAADGRTWSTEWIIDDPALYVGRP